MNYLTRDGWITLVILSLALFAVFSLSVACSPVQSRPVRTTNDASYATTKDMFEVLGAVQRVEALLNLQKEHRDKVQRESELAKACMDHCRDISDDDQNGDVARECYKECEKTAPWPLSLDQC